MIYYTSDTHFFHKNIISFCPITRGRFNDTNEMNECIISNWNSKVKDTDTVYILGDVVFGSNFDVIERLNGEKILIEGNHDRRLVKNKPEYFSNITQILNIKDGSHEVSLCHYRIYEWNGFHRGAIHLHGHSHNCLQSTKRAIDVGIDNPSWNLYPVTLEEILEESKNYIDHPNL